MGLVAFIGHNRIDARLIEVESIAAGDTIVSTQVSSLPGSGLHRTASEISGRNQLRTTIAGLGMTYKFKNTSLTAGGLYQSFVHALAPQAQLHQAHRPSGNLLLNFSISHETTLRNTTIFGETAVSRNGAIASTNGLLVSLGKQAALAMQVRTIPRHYQQLHGRTLTEGSRPENETGIYCGLMVKFNNNWSAAGYADIWHHKGPVFLSDRPTHGNEQLIRITYNRRKHTHFYVQYRHERRNVNASTQSNITKSAMRRRQYLRLHLERQPDRHITTRSRIEFAMFATDGSPVSHGLLIAQDVLYKPLGNPLSFTARLAYFDTDDYDSRIYAFENDIRYQFSIPAYAYHGIRAYINIRYRINRSIGLEVRTAHTRYFDRSTVGSGYDMIDGPARTTAKVQLTWKL